MTEIIKSDLCPNCGNSLDKLYRYYLSNTIHVIFNRIIYHNILCDNCNCTVEFIQFGFINKSFTISRSYYRILISNKHKIFNAFNKMIDEYFTYNDIDLLRDLDISNLPSSIEYKQELEIFIKLNL